MTPAMHSRTVALLAATLVFAALLSDSASSAASRWFASDAAIFTTEAGYRSPRLFLPLAAQTPAAISRQPTAQTSVGVETVPDSPAAVPLPDQAVVPVVIPGPLVDPSLSLLAGPIDVPLEIQIPALKIKADVLGVGLTLTDAMASPIGVLPDDAIWQTVFWYRGGGIPGDVGTATISGHFDDALGRPAVFAYLGSLRIGDLIIIQDKRSGLDVPFIVTETRTYTDQQAADPAVLARIFGSGSVSGLEPQPAAEQLSRLTLITCAGAWVNGSFNLRLVVYAVRASYPPGLGT